MKGVRVTPPPRSGATQVRHLRLDRSGPSVHLLLAGFLVLGVSALHIVFPQLVLAWLAIILLCVPLALRGAISNPSTLAAPESLLPALLAAGCLINVLLLTSLYSTPWPGVLLAVSAPPLSIWVARSDRPDRLLADRAVYFIVAYVALMTVWLASHHFRIDVVTVQEDAVRALLAGGNPYQATYRNIYTPEEMSMFYGPNMVGAVTLPGLPYPPLTFLLATPGYLLGDVRLSGLLLLATVCLVIVRLKDGRRPLGILLLTVPGSSWVVAGGWTEGLLVPLLTGAVLAFWYRRAGLAAAAVGLLFVSKQYFVALLPCLWLLRTIWTPRRLVVAVGAGVLATAPWVLTAFSEFLRSAVFSGFSGPIRPDSISLLVEAVRYLGVTDTPVLRFIPAVAAFVVTTSLGLLLSPRLDCFLVSVSLGLLAAALVGKQAFQNYYFFVGAALILAAWCPRYLGPVGSPEGPEEKDGSDARAVPRT